jgi:hypothetical protein
MTNQIIKSFDVGGGFKSMREGGSVAITYFTIVFGIMGHWIWEILVEIIRSGEFEFVGWLVVIARVGIALIAGMWSFTGIWKHLESVDKRIRFFLTFTQGFAVDALTGPVVI